MPSNLSNLKNKVEKLNVGKLVTVPVNSRKLSHVVKNDFVKKKIYIMLGAKILEIKYLILPT